MQARDTLHEVGRGVVAKVGGDVPDPDSIVCVELCRVLVWLLVKDVDLLRQKINRKW